MRMAAPPTEPELTAIDSLPVEMLTEVLLRVPTPAALVHAAAASRSWRSAIAHDGFLSRYRKRHKSSPFLGLYVPRQFDGAPLFQMPDSIRLADGDDNRDLKDAALRAYDFGQIRRYQDHRLHDADAFVLGRLRVHPDCRLLDCHNSRLLLTRGDEALKVRSPLARESILLPFPPHVVHPDRLEACLLQGHGHDEAAAAAFRVVYLQHRRQGRNRQARAVEYDSKRKSWQDHPWETLQSNIIEGTPEEVMHAGHRIFCKYTGLTSAALLLDTRNMQFSVLPLPRHRNFAIGETEDNTCCFVESDGCADPRLRVWQLDEKKLNWDLKKDIKMDQLLGKHVGYYRPRAISNGIALLCTATHHQHFVVDLNTCSVKEKFEFHGQSAYPMQMPWPPAFSGPTANGSHHPERRKSLIKLEQAARCHPKYWVKDPEVERSGKFEKDLLPPFSQDIQETMRTKKFKLPETSFQLLKGVDPWITSMTPHSQLEHNATVTPGFNRASDVLPIDGSEPGHLPECITALDTTMISQPDSRKAHLSALQLERCEKVNQDNCRTSIPSSSKDRDGESAKKTSNEEKSEDTSPEICVRSKDQDIDDTLEGLSQQDLCIKCGKDGQLLECSGCSLAAHDSCFGSSVTFEGTDLFYCPRCCYQKATEACEKAKKTYCEARKNAAAFLGTAHVSKQHDEQLNGVQPGTANRDGIAKQDQHMPTSPRKRSSVHPQKGYSNPDAPTERRKKLFWTKEEEAVLREMMEKFAPRDGAPIPWIRIREYGHHVFHETRLPSDLRVKWRNLMKEPAGY